MAAIAAYGNPKVKYGIMKKPAYCAFPARRRFLERKLKIAFPQVECVELEEWIERIDASQVSIVFASSYLGNPASIMGHTFLRFFNAKTESLEPQGVHLLSYSVGFLARTDARDNKFQYVLKGLTGGYSGYYHIEPYYMKVGLYNNSESRDLWERRLKLSPEEVRELLYYLWEVLFHGEAGYYFIDENCSYRMLTLLEVVRPDLELASKTEMIVLPAETVRLLEKEGLLFSNNGYKSSIQHRLIEQMEGLSQKKVADFHRGEKTKDGLTELQDSRVLDALIDHWTYENYAHEGKLPAEKKEIMEAVFRQRAKVKNISKRISDEEIRSKYNLHPTYEGHMPRWFWAETGTSGGRPTLSIGGKLGAHASWQNTRGYERFSSIEYLGLQLEVEKGENRLASWKVQIAEVRSLNPISRIQLPFSWAFNLSIKNQGDEGSGDEAAFTALGGLGLSSEHWGHLLVAMINLEIQTWNDGRQKASLNPGGELGLQLKFSSWNLLAAWKPFWNRGRLRQKTEARVTFHIGLNTNIYLLGSESDKISQKNGQERRAFVGFSQNF